MHRFTGLLIGGVMMGILGHTHAIAAENHADQLPYKPGGMWMPQQVAELHGETLKQMGLEIDPAAFADPLQYPLNAIVSLGGCSASFISPDGLIITNYHCVRGYLQYNSTEEKNLLQEGYLAKRREEELFAGPTARVYVIIAVTDVTERVLAGVRDIADDLARYKELETREKRLIEECEKATPNVRCEVARFYGGGKFYLITKLEIKDVRLVYAPHRGLGEFGGDIDNWMWPRQCADFSLLRAYVKPDGTPGDHAMENVPFHPKAYLKIAKEGFQPGDLAFVVGFPGTTERLSTALECEEEIEWRLPRLIALFRDHMELVDGMTKDDSDLKIKAATLYSGLSNMEKKWTGTLDGAERKDLVRFKQKEEKSLLRWIRSSSERRKNYGDVVERINTLVKENQKKRDTDLAVRYLGHSFINPLVNAGVTIVRMAEERPKPDADRDPDYQERNWQRLEQAQERLQKTYSRAISRSVLALNLNEGLALPTEQRPELLKEIFSDGTVPDEKVQQWVSALFTGTAMEDLETRRRLLKEATTEELQQNPDPLIQFALKLSPVLESLKDKDKRLSGAMVLIRPLYFQALEAFYQGKLAPDANGTIRLSFGTVRGFRPTPEQEMYYPFTKIWDVPEKWTKHQGEFPFELPGPFLEALRERRFGAYADNAMGEAPVNFFTDLDITNGNSGSATLNRRAELAGIAFDGNIEGVASDLVFLEETTRAIHVDIRYILWMLDAVEGAGTLLREMGIEPEFAK